MKFDLAHFKKVASDGASTTLQHPQGHQIKIAHKVLTSKMREQLESLPAAKMMAEGGDSSDDQPQTPTVNINLGGQGMIPQNLMNPNAGMQAMDSSPVQVNPQATQNPGQSMYGVDPEEFAKMQEISKEINQKPAPEFKPQQVGYQPVNSPEMQQQPIQQQQNDPWGTNAMSQNYGEAMANQGAGIMGQAEAQSQIGKQEAQAAQQNIQAQQQLLSSFKENSQAVNNEISGAIKDYEQGHIDPMRYVHQMGAGQRISTAIGLLLGGIAGGGLHQENPALKSLNQQIENDIGAQKADFGKKENLISAYYKKFGNLRDATDMARVVNAGIYSSKIQLAAAQSADPMARARAMQAIGQLQAQYAPIAQQIAMRQSVQGMGNNMDPGSVIRMIVPEHQQQAAYKELNDSQRMVRARDSAMNTFNNLTQINTVGNRLSSPLQTSKQVQALRDNAAIELARDEAGRVNEYEFAAAKAAFPAPGDTQETLMRKRQNLLGIIQKKMSAPMLQSYGINPFSSGKYNEQGQSRIQLGAPVLSQR